MIDNKITARRETVDAELPNAIPLQAVIIAAGCHETG
jgi:hypothetical protein